MQSEKLSNGEVFAANLSMTVVRLIYTEIADINLFVCQIRPRFLDEQLFSFQYES